MTEYVVNDNAQANGDHEVHTKQCTYFPMINSYTYLGSHTSCISAVRKAKEYYSQSNGCALCSPSCHTS